MEANEFVGFTLPVVNAGPWSYFSNGGNSNGGNDGEEETMIVNGSIDGDGAVTIDETSKTIFDAIASGKVVIAKIEDIAETERTVIDYSIILEALLIDNEYTFSLIYTGQIITISGAADENPTGILDI